MFFNIVSAKECQVLTNPFVECPPIREDILFLATLFACISLYLTFVAVLAVGGSIFLYKQINSNTRHKHEAQKNSIDKAWRKRRQ